jgi:hypothetical protein
MAYGVFDNVTSPMCTHTVEPFGRCASRTSSQPGNEPITGSADG